MTFRAILFIGLTLISILPVAVLTVWTGYTAFDQRMATASESHLVLARNLTGALSRYVRDVESVFRTVSQNMRDKASDEMLRPLLRDLHFDHVDIIDGGGRILAQRCGMRCADKDRIASAIIDRLAPQISAAREMPGMVYMSGVIPGESGAPTIFLLLGHPDATFTLGVLATDYIRAIQRSVTFGEKGHAAIVDQHGRVLAHPNATWTMSMKNISKVSAVRKMMAGKTGVVEFYSPALKADMIAGHTVEPRTGWGIMIPQPVSELAAEASHARDAAILIGGSGVVVAVLIAWWLAGLLARPLQALVATADDVAAGNLDARARAENIWLTRELKDLMAAFNGMIESLARKNREATALAAAAEEANSAKSDFLSNVSHELRTPLNAVMGFSQLIDQLPEGPVDRDRVKAWGHQILTSGRHLLRLVDDILSLSEIDTGRLKLNKTAVAVGDVLAACEQHCGERARAAEINLTFTVAAGVDTVTADSERLDQVLRSLIENAIKYTDPGGQVQVFARPGSPRGVKFVIQDNGHGIAAEDQERILAPFEQVRRNHFDATNEGFGLGLSLARHLVEMHGGTLTLESTVGTGTTVSVHLPA